MTPHLDFYNAMCYDFAGSWDPTAGHQANLFPSASNPRSTPFSTSAAITHYLSQGVPARKLILGMPLYGRSFAAEGPGKTVSPGNSDGGGGGQQGSWEPGVWDYKALPREGARECVDAECGAGWSYDAARREMVSYDSGVVAAWKVGFIKGGGLGGGMWWESSADKSGEESLIAMVVKGLGGNGGQKMDKSHNTLVYPGSKFDNLRKGFPGE
ncbi:hypothetical protein MMC24_004157 [Lignoscripta atroalba]|nr:hypothetical protein [Lignoscripta atroalba]